MQIRSGAVTVRYPAHAVLAVLAAGLLFVFNLVTGFLFMALVPPLIPVYITVLFGTGSVVRMALDYAVRVSAREPAGMLPSGNDQEARQQPFATRAA